MKKTSLYAIALLLVPWSSCTEPAVHEIANPAAPVRTMAKMILPDVKDTTLPSGRRNIYLSGLRTQPGFFVERSWFPSGYKGMPHVHNRDLYVTILEGSVYFGTGNKLDTVMNSKQYGPGSFWVIPADQPHYEWFSEDCMMQIEGMGPNETYYVTDNTRK
jgi:quercetin dioxygenase-like cupin family protein